MGIPLALHTKGQGSIPSCSCACISKKVKMVGYAVLKNRKKLLQNLEKILQILFHIAGGGTSMAWI
jgi:hypothetical protein